MSLERSLHALNTHIFVLKIGQENDAATAVWSDPTLWFWPIFVVERSTSMGLDRDVTHYIVMVTRKGAECIQQMTARRQAVDSRKNDLRSCSTGQERSAFSLGSQPLASFTQDNVAYAFEKVSRSTFHDWMRNEKTFPAVCLLWW